MLKQIRLFLGCHSFLFSCCCGSCFLIFESLQGIFFMRQITHWYVLLVWVTWPSTTIIYLVPSSLKWCQCDGELWTALTTLLTRFMHISLMSMTPIMITMLYELLVSHDDKSWVAISLPNFCSLAQGEVEVLTFSY